MNPTSSPTATTLSGQHFGTLPDGTHAVLYTLTSPTLTVQLTNFGARIVSILAPSRNGEVADVTLGLKTLDEYVGDRNTFLGAVVGRFGNRIANGRFTLAGQTYQVPPNDNTNALHGGPEGFDRHLFTTQEISNGVAMTLISPAGDQGFPGTLTLTVTYTLDGHTLSIDYTATTDAPTIVNVTNHAYFNLAGESSGSILGHTLQLHASHYTPTDELLIPTGDLTEVANTPFDFREPHVIGDRIEANDLQLQRAGGYDHNWVLDVTPASQGALKTAAVLKDPTSGRVLTVETTEPGIQFYSGNFLKGTLPNRAGGLYTRRTGLCLETQHFPDSPNHLLFPTTTLSPGETMRSTTTLTFTTE